MASAVCHAWLTPSAVTIRVLAFGVAYLLATRLGFLFPSSHQVIMAIWPASGVALAALLLNPRRLWPALIATQVTWGVAADVMFAGRTFPASMGFVGASTLEAAGCAYLITRVCGDGIRFDRVRELLTLAIAAVFVNGATACIGAATAALSAGDSFWTIYPTWWTSNGLGILLVTPAIVSWRNFHDLFDDGLSHRLIEAVAFWIVWCIGGWLAFNVTATSYPMVPSPYMLSVLLVWPALRIGQRGVTLALVVLAVYGVLSSTIAEGASPLGGTTPHERLLLLQAYLGITGIMGFLLASSWAETKAAEQAARDEQDRLRVLGDRIPDAMVYQVVREPDGTMRFLYLSRGVERLHGVTAEAAMRDADALYGQILPEDRPAVAAAEAESAVTMKGFSVVARFRGADGAVRWMELASTPLHLPDGRLMWDGIEIDITNRKREEAERERLQSQLAQAQKMESIGRLAGGVAHDFNNMLGVIMGHTELVLADLEPGHPLRADIEEISRAAGRSADLTRQLLAFARKQTVLPQVLDLNATVAGMLKMLGRLIGEDINLLWVPGADLWPVCIDPAQLDQILANLCVNARDAISGVGHVTIRTSMLTMSEDAEDRPQGFVPGSYVVIEVSDDGAGMASDVLAHVFEPFFTTKGVGRGTGLGLSTVFGIVKQNDGYIGIDSAPGRGTTVWIYLPRAEGAGVAPDEARAAETPRGSGQTILLVEDEPALLDLGATVLRRLGYTVLAAGTPGKALRLAKAHVGRIELLITDVVMPEMNGVELAAKVEALAPHARRLFTSGYTADVMAHRGVLDARVQFLQKPFSMQALAMKVRETLDAPPRPKP